MSVCVCVYAGLLTEGRSQRMVDFGPCLILVRGPNYKADVAVKDRKDENT